MWGRRRGIGIDVNGDGIPDFRIGRFGVRPDIGLAFPGGYPPMGYAPMGYPGMYPMGAGVDLDGDGISDLRVGPFGQVRPDIGMFVKGPVPGPYMYGYGPAYYPPPYY